MKELSPFETFVIENKGTEPPFTGEYTDHSEKGLYLCKKCETPLYTSDSKFPSHCGWPSFDQEIPNAIKHIPDRDGQRIEIICANCNAHLGHVFKGERYTPLNTRHCVNSISLIFKPDQISPQKRAVFASGCFWGTQYHFAKAKGVIESYAGYIGGSIPNPTYQQVCTGKTGHLEAVEVLYNPLHTDYESLTKLFFETHNFSQENGQGPDIGPQYLSAIFIDSEEQRNIALKLIEELKTKGHSVATTVREMSPFYRAEEYHQKYDFKNAQIPYCHIYRQIF